MQIITNHTSRGVFTFLPMHINQGKLYLASNPTKKVPLHIISSHQASHNLWIHQYTVLTDEMIDQLHEWVYRWECTDEIRRVRSTFSRNYTGRSQKFLWFVETMLVSSNLFVLRAGMTVRIWFVEPIFSKIWKQRQHRYCGMSVRCEFSMLLLLILQNTVHCKLNLPPPPKY